MQLTVRAVLIECEFLRIFATFAFFLMTSLVRNPFILIDCEDLRNLRNVRAMFRGELLALSSDLEKNLDYLCFAITAETRLLPLLKNILKREPLKEIARADCHQNPGEWCIHEASLR